MIGRNNWSKLHHWSKWPVNKDKCQSTSKSFIGIDRYWPALGIDQGSPVYDKMLSDKCVFKRLAAAWKFIWQNVNLIRYELPQSIIISVMFSRKFSYSNNCIWHFNQLQNLNLKMAELGEKLFPIKGWNVIISKDRAQKGKRKATAAAAIADGWNIKDKQRQHRQQQQQLRTSEM